MRNLHLLAFMLLAGCSSGFAPYDNLNRDIFINHTYVSDQRKHGLPDVWEIDCNVGDCEDFSLCLMQRIGRTSSLVVCENEQGGHAIVKEGGWYYDPTYGYSGKTPPCRVIFILPYQTAMKLVNTKSNEERFLAIKK